MSTAVGHAVVVGGSIAGLAAAAALAPRVDRVTVVAHHDLTPDAKGAMVGHGAFPHVLLGGGAAALERLVPGFVADLYAHGAVGQGQAERRCHWWAAGVVRTSVPELGVDIPMCSRALVEERLRAAVLALPNVVAAGGTTVHGVRGDRDRIVGVEVAGASGPGVIDADLVVDASGRGGRSSAWLASLGLEPAPSTEIGIDIGYTAVDVVRRPGDLGGALFAVVQNSPELARIGVALPAEGDRWQIVLGGYFGDAAEPTPDGMLAFAAALPDPVIAELLQQPWLGAAQRHRFRSSRRNHYDKARLPANLCVVGDAVASFNPVFGQGMSSAALQAERLGRGLDEHGNTRRLAASAAKAAGRVVDNPWRVAAGADLVYPQTTGPKPAGTDRINRYLHSVTRAAASDERVDLALTRVLHLLAPASSLLAPAMVWRVRRVTRALERSPGAVALPGRAEATSS